MDPITEIWMLEDELWQSVQQQDTEKAQSLYADSAIGWPIDNELTLDKKGLDAYLVNACVNMKLLSYTLTNKVANNPSPDLVNAFYYVSFVYDYVHQPNSTDIGSIAGTQKYFHAWNKLNGVWQIVAGMSAAPA